MLMSMVGVATSVAAWLNRELVGFVQPKLNLACHSEVVYNKLFKNGRARTHYIAMLVLQSSQESVLKIGKSKSIFKKFVVQKFVVTLQIEFWLYKSYQSYIQQQKAIKSIFFF